VSKALRLTNETHLSDCQTARAPSKDEKHVIRTAVERNSKSRGTRVIPTPLREQKHDGKMQSRERLKKNVEGSSGKHMMKERYQRSSK